MGLRSRCGTPLGNNAGFTRTHTPTLSSTLMGAAALRSNRSHAMATRMSITGGSSKILKCKTFSDYTVKFVFCL